MTDIEEAIAALQAGEYDEADRILEALGASKPGAASLRGRMLWAITQVLRWNFGNETAEAILEVGRRIPNREASVYQKVLSAVGPLEAFLTPAAAQEIRLRIGGFFVRRGGNEAEAPPWLTAARAANPEDAIAAYWEAYCRFLLYGERQAVREMEAVLEKAVADVDRSYLMSGRTEGFYYHLGHAQEKIENYEGAAYYFAKAVEINGTNDIPRVSLGAVLIRLGRFAEAAEQLAQVNKYATDYLAAVRLRAVALYRLGHVNDAVALLQEAAELDPLGATTFLELGRMHLLCGDLDSAEVALARAFRTDPSLPDLKSAMATLERLLGRHVDPDAGLPVAAEFTIPEQFRPRPDDPALAERPHFRTAVAAYVRVIRALIVRDILALYAHSGIGYFWALAQPLTFIATIALIWILAGHQAPFHTSIIAYLAAGVVPYVNFYVRTMSSVSSAVRGNVSLLWFRQVTPLALITAATVREFLTSLVVFVIIAGGIAAYDPSVQITDPLTILAALVCISLLGVIVGTLFGLGELAFPALQLVEVVFARIMFFFSGVFYYANTLPPKMREFALLNPLLHLIEFVRNGFFATYHSRYANWHYPLEIIAGGLVLVAVLLYSSRPYLAVR